MAETIDRIYSITDKFSAVGADLTNETEEFQFLLDSAKTADTKCKVLIAGLIPQYVGSFSAMAKSAVDAQLDICEDDEVSVRLAAIRGLARLAESLQDAADVERVLDAVLQLLLTVEDSEEEVALTHVLTLLANTRIEALITCCLNLLPQQVDAPRTKLFAILTSLFDASKQKGASEQVKANSATVAAQLHGFLVANATVLDEAEFKDLYRLYATVAPLNGKTYAQASPAHLAIINARSGLDRPLTAESLPAAAKAVHMLSRVLSTRSADASSMLVGTYRAVIAAVPLATTPEATAAVSTLFAFLVSAVKHLDARHCNALFPSFLAAVKSVLPVEPAETYPYALIARMFELFHALAHPLKDSLRDLTGLDLPSIQPSSVSADTRAQRLADLQQRVAAFVSVADALVAQMRADAAISRPRADALLKQRRKEAAAARAAAAAAMLDATAAPVVAPEEAAPAAATEAEAEDGEVADADQAAEADAEAAAADLTGEAEADAEAEAEAEAVPADADTEVVAEPVAEPVAPVVPFTSEELDAFRAQQRTNGAIISAVARAKSLMQPIADNKPVFLTVSQQAAQNKSKADHRRGGRDAKNSSKAAPQQQAAGRSRSRGGRGRRAGADKPQQPQQSQQQHGRGQRQGGRDSGNRNAPRDQPRGGRGGRDQTPRDRSGRDQPPRGARNSHGRDQGSARRSESPSRGPRNDRDRDHRRRR